MSKNIYNYTMAALICSLSFPAEVQAQQADTTLTQSLTIERAYSPVIKEANKIDRQPAIEPVQVNHMPPVYANKNSVPVRPDEITSQKVGQVIAENESEQNGYVQLSAGNFWNTDLKAGYHNGEFDVEASGFFTAAALHTPFNRWVTDETAPKLQHSYDASVENGKPGTWNSNLCTGRIAGQYNHTFQSMNRLHASLAFAGTAADMLNYAIVPYFSQPDPESDMQVELFQDKLKDYRQHWGLIQAAADYEHELFDVSLKYEHVGLKYPDNYENSISLGGHVMLYQNDNWIYEMGLNTALFLGRDKNYFTIKPQLEMSYIPDPLAYRRAYATLGIGSRRDGMFDLMQQLPMAYMTNFKNTVDAFDLTLGWEDSENGAFTYGASIHLCNSINELDILMSSYHNGENPRDVFDISELNLREDQEPQMIMTTDPQECYPTLGLLNGTYAMLTNEDSFEFTLEGHFRYECNRHFGMSAQFFYYYSSCDLMGMAEPTVELNAHLFGDIKKLHWDLGFDGRFDREMYYYTLQKVASTLDYTQYRQHFETIDLGNIANLDLHTDYQVKKNLKVSLFANNILNHKYQMWGFAPVQGINVHAGFTWNF